MAGRKLNTQQIGDRGRRMINSVPIFGPIAKTIFGDPDQEAHERAMKQASNEMSANRVGMMESRVGSMQNMAQAFEPMNQMLQQMYGGSSAGQGQNGGLVDLQALTKNPFTQGMQDNMYQSAFGHKAPPGSAAPPPGFANGQNPQLGNAAFSPPQPRRR
jgi:hypothetical protein